ncbi:MAG TPA: hypothetical protein VEX86_07500 [Longimicrobium sp.]|nr:hypothetical protein [Longimicrobium sp.]
MSAKNPARAAIVPGETHRGSSTDIIKQMECGADERSARGIVRPYPPRAFRPVDPTIR